MQKVEEPKWEWINCDGCGRPLPRSEIVLVVGVEELLEGADAKHLCSHCLIYWLGEFIGRTAGEN